MSTKSSACVVAAASRFSKKCLRLRPVCSRSMATIRWRSRASNRRRPGSASAAVMATSSRVLDIGCVEPRFGLIVHAFLEQRQQRHLLLLHVGQHALRSEEHTSELQSRRDLVCRLLLEKKKK